MTTRTPPPVDFKWNAQTIKALRVHMALTQVNFSTVLGIRQQTVSEWERGIYEPQGASITVLTLLAVTHGFDWRK